MHIEEIIDRFHNVKKIGDKQYQCSCSVHKDDKPSLTIAEEDNKILMYCHAGCDTKDILAKVGLQEKDLFNNVQEKPRVIAEYIYSDENNKPLYKVMRFEPKNFIQAKYDNGNWIFKMTGVNYVPYNLPNVIKSNIVYFVEGEKDANNLNSLGLVATTTAGGAASFKKRASEYVKWLKNKTVYIIPDNDKAGYKYAENIKNALLEQGTKDVKILELVREVPDLKEKEDISDVLLKYGKNKTVQILEELKNKSSSIEVSNIHYNSPLNLETFEDIIKKIGIQIRYNKISGGIEIINFNAGYSKDNCINTFPIWITNYINNIGIKCTEQKVQRFITALADRNSYNPIKELIESLKWDKKSRLYELYSIMGVTNEAYKTYIKKWLIQCVALLHNSFENNIYPEGILILQGGQGIGKTSFFRKISINSNWFLEGATLNIENKDDLIKCFSFWITELGEIDFTLKKGQSALKGIMTRCSDTIRYPYEKNFTTKPRVTSFCGTVNEDNFIKDLTGSRRLWIVKLNEKFNIKKILNLSREWILQLWSEINFIFNLEGIESFRLTPEERKKLEENNRQYDVILDGEQEIEDNLDFSLNKFEYTTLTATGIKDLLDIKLDSSKVGKALNHLITRYPEYVTKGREGNNKVYTLPIKKRK